MARADKHNYYLSIAEAVLGRGTCLRRNFGAVIVNHDKIVSTGYAGAPRGRENCVDKGLCIRNKFNIPRGERYEFCRSVHAEMNAVIHASRDEMLGSTLYLVGKEVGDGSYVKDAAPCTMCKRVIINSGVKNLVARIDGENYKITEVKSLIENDETLENMRGY